MFDKFIVEKDFHNSRFDKWFKSKVLDIPQSLIEKIVRKNKVKVNKKRTKTSHRVQYKDVVTVYGLSKIKESTKLKTGAKVFLHKVSKPELYGVAKINKKRQNSPELAKTRQLTPEVASSFWKTYFMHRSIL